MYQKGGIRMRRIIALTLVFLMAFPVGFAFGTNNVFTLEGKVSDLSGKPIFEAKVSVVTGFHPEAPVFQSKTDIKGEYKIERIPSASPRYMLEASMDGYLHQIAGDIDISFAEKKVDFKLTKVEDVELFRTKKLKVKMGYLQKIIHQDGPVPLPKIATLDKAKYPKKILPFLQEGEGTELTQNVKDRANSILSGIPKPDQTNAVVVARAVYEWIIQNIEYDLVNNYKGDVTCGNYQTTFGGFAKDFFDWCYSPEDVLKEKRAICIEYERLTTSLLRCLGIPARPAPLMAHPVTQFWVQPENGDGFWSNLEPSIGRNIYKDTGNKGAKFPSVADSEIALIPVDANAPIHMKWDFGGKIWWREDYGQHIDLGDGEKAFELGRKELQKFSENGEFIIEGKKGKPEKISYFLYSRGFEVDLAQAQNLHPVVKFPEFLENTHRQQLGMNWYVSIPEIIEKTWIEEEKNDETGLVQKWQCMSLDLTKVKQQKLSENQLGNPGFEDGEAGWEMFKPPNTVNAKLEISGTVFKSGKKSAYVELNGQGVVGWNQMVGLKTPAKVRVSGWIKTQDVKQFAQIEVIEQKMQQGKPPFPACKPQLKGTNDWTFVEGEFKVAEGSRGVAVQCMILGGGKAWFDDITLEIIEGEAQEKMPEFDTVWVENPDTKVKLYTLIGKPKNFDESIAYPVVCLLPGGNGFGSQLKNSQVSASLRNEGFVVVMFDPDGRGMTLQGEDDTSGPKHQAGFHAVLKHVASLSYVDKSNIGLYTMSFGIILGACTTGRYLGDPPVRYIVDWEGPDGHLCKKNHVKTWDMEFWKEREALDFIKKFPGKYVRLQSEKDHVQDTNDHALRMINAATNVEFGGEGNCSFTRVNAKDGESGNSPNVIYKDDNLPKWIPESKDRTAMDELPVAIIKELAFSVDDDPKTPPRNIRKKIGLGRNRLGIMPFSLPKYSPEKTREYLKQLGVRSELDYMQKVIKEVEPLNFSFQREDFFMFAGVPEWKQNARRMAFEQGKGIRHLVTFRFRDPKKDAEVAKNVAEVVEFFDGDGIGDNEFGAVIKDWQIENEINMGKVFWTGSVDDYVAHYNNCAKAIRNADPEAKVVLAGEASDVENKVYSEILTKLDKNALDAVDIHVYGEAGDVFALETWAKRFKGWLKDAGFDENLPMYLTEYGTYTDKMKNMPDSNERIQAETIAGRTILGAHLNLSGMCYFSFVDGYGGMNEDLFNQMGLLYNGSGNSQAWKKKLSYWTFMGLSNFLSQVSFGNSKEIPIGEGVRCFKFMRPGADEIYFVIPKDSSKISGISLPFKDKFMVTPLVPKGKKGDEFENFAQACPSKYFDQVLDKDKILEMLSSGPIVIQPMYKKPLSERIGFGWGIMANGLENSSLSGWIRLNGMHGLNFPPRSDALGNPDFMPTDFALRDATVKKLKPMIQIQLIDELGNDGEKNKMFFEYLRLASERYDGDGIDDAPDSPVCLDYILTIDLDTSKHEQISAVLRGVYMALKSADKRAKLILGNMAKTDKNSQGWKKLFESLRGLKDQPGYPFFDALDIGKMATPLEDNAQTYNALNMLMNTTRKALDEAGFGRIDMMCTSTSSYSGNPGGENPPQTEREQAGELVKRFVTILANRGTRVLWRSLQDFHADPNRITSDAGLLDVFGNKKMSYYSYLKFSETLSTITIPEDFDRLTEKGAIGQWNTPDKGLWGLKIGFENNSFIVAWVNGSNPPSFTTAEYDLPNTDAIEITYLVPEGDLGMNIKTPIYKRIILEKVNGTFQIPVDRLDPFIIRPTTAKAEKPEITLDKEEITVTEGRKVSVKLTIKGISGMAKVEASSTKTLPVTISPSEIGNGGTALITVSPDSSVVGKTIALTITVTTSSGSFEKVLRVTVEAKKPVNITCHVGKTEATVNGQKTTLKVPPTIVKGSTMVPVRFISEAFGAVVKWDEKEQRIDLIFGQSEDGTYIKKVTLWVGKTNAVSDFGSWLPAQQEHELSSPPVIIKGTTMVPIRFISEVLEAEVKWTDKEKRIDITWMPF
jgi:hypothetical protein